MRIANARIKNETSCRATTSISADVCRLLLVLFILAIGCSSAASIGFPMRVRDGRGEIVVIRRKPTRIVSLTPSNTEILYSLGLGDRVVGVTRYCDYPAEAKKKPKVGDIQINTEAVLALKPDLILAHAVLNDSVIPRLEKLGLTVFAVNPVTIGHVARDIRTIGRITGRPRTAARIASLLETKVKNIAIACAKRPLRRVLVVVQSNPLWVAGPRTFVDEMIQITHAKNVAFDARPGFVTFSKELAIARNPDVIVVGIEADAKYFLKSPEWRRTNAVKNKRVFVIKSDLMVRAGPRLAVGLEQLARVLDY